MAKKTPLPANAAPQASESRFKGRHRRAMRGRQTADRHHGSEMIEADDRMAETGKKPVLERRRHRAAHDVVGESLRRGQARDGEGQAEANGTTIHDDLRTARLLAHRPEVYTPQAAFSAVGSFLM